MPDDLIARIEGADPTNAYQMASIACDVHLALGLGVIPKRYARGSASGRYLIAHGPRGAVWTEDVPNYCGSIDAAVALASRVYPGGWLDYGVRNGRPFASQCFEGNKGYHAEPVTTLPLTICAAILKASAEAGEG